MTNRAYCSKCRLFHNGKCANCSLCGKAGAVYDRPYRYDSGQITIEKVCPNCEKIHRQLTKEKI